MKKRDAMRTRGPTFYRVGCAISTVRDVSKILTARLNLVGEGSVPRDDCN